MRRNLRGQRGLTLLEVLVASAILTMVATMIWVSFDQTAKMRVKLTERQEHDHYARSAMARLTRDMRACATEPRACELPYGLFGALPSAIIAPSCGSVRKPI